MVVRIGQRNARPRRTFFREWRQHRGLTQEQLAERLNGTKASVSKMELGHIRYNQDNLEAWALALQCEPSDLISRMPDDLDTNVLIDQAPDDVRSVIFRLLKSGG